MQARLFPELSMQATLTLHHTPLHYHTTPPHTTPLTHYRPDRIVVIVGALANHCHGLAEQQPSD